MVDLDGTLLATDSLDEQAVRLLFRDPVGLARTLIAARGGRAALKQALAAAEPEVDDAWPLNEAFVGWLRAQAQAGRELHLCSAAHQSIVDAVAARLVYDRAVAEGAGR